MIQADRWRGFERVLCATLMLIVLSPAKTLDFSPAPMDVRATKPAFAKRTAELAKLARALSAADLKRLMGISDKLAALNVERFRAFGSKTAEAVPAALAFAGDVYAGLKARELDAEALAFAQDRLRILSGLYGVLRPLDGIEPYRLEMGVKLANPAGSDLYSFWRESVTQALDKDAGLHGDPVVVNLSSQEYFGAVDRSRLKARVLTCHFKEAAQDGSSRMIAFYAKRARGLMARYALDERLDRIEGLKSFDREGYRFQPDLSDEEQWTFTRPAR